MKVVDEALDRFLPKTKEVPSLLHQAMRYSALSSGKRIRPILTLAVSDMLGGSRGNALIPASAIEMIHSYSLVHDDLPCMDNDDLRRGRPTCHKKFDEATAVLVGDGLLTEAFRLLGTYPDAKRAKRLTGVIAESIGSRGMIGGQFLDKIFENKTIDKITLDLIHVNKTGKLLANACLAGAISARATKAEEKRIFRFGETIGFVFQIIDDILDKDGYLQFMSVSEAREEASYLTSKAKAELKPFGKKAETLIKIAEFLGKRKK